MKTAAMEHTPKPWEFISPGHEKEMGRIMSKHRLDGLSQDDYQIGWVIMNTKDDPMDNANGTLLAAAPDLLSSAIKALLWAVDYSSDMDGEIPTELHEVMTCLRVAIEKAEGRPQ